MNLNEVSIREKYKEFYGRNTEQMELLIKDKRIPMTMKQIIERRLNSKNNEWKVNYFDTCDAIVYGKDKFKIVLNSEILKKITENTKLKNGTISISEEDYKRIKLKEFSKKTPGEEIWKYLLRDLYKPYIKILGYVPDFYISDEEFCVMTWYVCGLGSRSDASGRSDLDIDDGRFVGIASEMLKEK